LRGIHTSGREGNGHRVTSILRRLLNARAASQDEQISAGFWPGSGSLLKPAFYAYTLPAPAGIEKATIRPEKAYFDGSLGEHILLDEDVRTASEPDEALLDFLQSSYETGANLGKWDRMGLEARLDS